MPWGACFQLEGVTLEPHGPCRTMTTPSRGRMANMSPNARRAVLLAVLALVSFGAGYFVGETQGREDGQRNGFIEGRQAAQAEALQERAQRR